MILNRFREVVWGEGRSGRTASYDRVGLDGFYELLKAGLLSAFHPDKFYAKLSSSWVLARVWILHELLVGSDDVRGAIHTRAKTHELLSLAMMEGMTTLFQDGVLKVLQGHTTLKQVRTVAMR